MLANERCGFLGYRMAKAALNQQNKTIAQAFREDFKIIFLALEPGNGLLDSPGGRGKMRLIKALRACTR